MTRKQFEKIGFDFVQCHFRKFETFRLYEQDASRLFGTDDEKRLLKKHVPVSIYRHYETGNLLIKPCKFRNYNLGGIVTLDLGLFPNADIPFESDRDAFVRAFDAVAAEAG